MKTINSFLLALLILVAACLKDENPHQEAQQLTIFFVNDVHGQLENFAKVKHIIDFERQESNVFVVSSGDIFSGNPVVDNAMDKGYPVIDIMNRIGFDVAVLGNHEFDYGTDILQERIDQSDFNWICANVDKGTTNLVQPDAYSTLEIDGLRITFLGLIETNGKDN